MTPINVKRVRVQSFSIECSESLQYGNSVILGVSGDVVQITGNDNQDGTQNVTYTVKPLVVQIDKIVEGKREKIAETEHAGKSASKQARARCYRIGLEIGESEESLYALYNQAGIEAIENHRLSVIGYGEEK